MSIASELTNEIDELAAKKLLEAYRAIIPSMKNILQCLICFNMPFTIAKGLICTGVTMLIYKHLSPILKGTR